VVVELVVGREMNASMVCIERNGDVLSSESILLHRYGSQLQSIDLMMQQLGHLASVIATEDKAAAAEQVSLQELRQRLNRRSIRSILA
jgi:hypothetical protein